MSQFEAELLGRVIQITAGLKQSSLFFRGDHLLVNKKIASFLFYSILLILAVSGTSAADDSEWRIYSREANGDVHFFDASRVKTNSNVHTVWKRIRYKRTVMAAASYESLLEIDCSERTERILQRTFFSDKNWEKPAMNTDMKEKPKRPIVEGSAEERLSEILCNP